MKTLTFISDTHCKHNQITNLLTGGDFLIHTGDWTNNGNFTQIKEFLTWFNSQTQYKHKIFIAGNHELGVEQYPLLFKEMLVEYAPDCHYLQDSSICLEEINFYGTPVTANFCNWAFNKNSEQLIKHFEAIPKNTNVLLTHGGSKLQKLYNEVDVSLRELKPVIKTLPDLKISAFGHIHSAYGKIIENGVTYVNSAIVGENYQVTNNPIQIPMRYS